MADTNVTPVDVDDYKHQALFNMSTILATISGTFSLIEHSEACDNDEDITDAIFLLHTAKEQVEDTRRVLDEGIVAESRERKARNKAQ